MKRSPPLVRRLAQLYGDDSEKLLAEVHKIAFGEAEVREPTDLDGTLDKITRPSMRERLDALRLLLAYQQGNPISRAEVAIEEKNARKWNPDALSFTELQEMDRLARKARGELPSGTVIDAVFTPAPGRIIDGEMVPLPALPSGEDDEDTEDEEPEE